MPFRLPPSVPDVVDVELVRGALAGDAPPALLLEVAHGATRASHFDRLRAALHGDYPDALRDFFFVNTDVGAPEVARRAAERFVEQAPRHSALVVRSLVPRTFVDCNRIIDAATAPSRSGANEPTPGLHVWVTDARDRALLLERHGAWRAAATAAIDLVCGDGGEGGGGLALQVHSYAPRSIDVPVDERIVERLRAEYRPERIEHWPLRAAVDLITADPDGVELAAPALAAHAERELAAAGFEVARNRSYALHPAALAHAFAVRHPARTLCLELRRDLLVPEFTPFAEMTPDAQRVDRAAAPLARATVAALAQSRDPGRGGGR